MNSTPESRAEQIRATITAHVMPASWQVHAWSAGEGFGGQADERTNNGKRERIWFSPACLGPKQPELFS